MLIAGSSSVKIFMWIFPLVFLFEKPRNISSILRICQLISPVNRRAKLAKEKPVKSVGRSFHRQSIVLRWSYVS